ncbi:MAG: protease inhibitor I42 family protein [Endomicrobia bacterium]|nr:protease inhibitor I42 family protein [Endomicrobiia bacterium]MCL2506681.1 protease inhibitor I42 family protein [Endomicrobiia bacterium]
MKKLFVFISLITFFTLGISACAPSVKQAVISLDGNPTTGYSWTYRQTNEGIVREVSSKYESEQSDLMGRGGTFIFVFKGINKGETELIFEYLRPWEEGIKPIETKTYIFKVDANKHISFTQK